jgi:hypothetical protein
MMFRYMGWTEAADRIVRHPELNQELVRRGGDQVSASLGRSWLMGLETAM